MPERRPPRRPGLRSRVFAMVAVFAQGCALHAEGAAGRALDTATTHRPCHDDLKTPIPLNIVLPPVSKDELANLRNAPKGHPLQVGFARPIPAPYTGNLQPLLTWLQMGNGQATAVFAVTSPSAQALRLALDVTELPEGFELRFFDPCEPTRAFGPFTAREMLPPDKEPPSTPTNSALYWSPVIEGDSIGVELRIPDATQQRGVRLKLAQVSHLSSIAR